MAEVMAVLPDRKRKPDTYDKFMDGQAWKLVIGVDCSAKTVRNAVLAARAAAVRRGLKVRYRKLSETEFAMQAFRAEGHR